MNDTRKKGGLQTVLQQQQSKKLYKKRLKGTCRLADYVLEPMHLPQTLDFVFTKVNIKTSDVYDGNFLSSA